MYQGRDDFGILNLWLRDLRPVAGPVADRSKAFSLRPIHTQTRRQLTFHDDYDACELCRWASERYVVYLRATANGSEFFHLHRLDLQV